MLLDSKCSFSRARHFTLSLLFVFLCFVPFLVNAEESALLSTIYVDGDKLWRSTSEQEEPLWEVTHLSIRQNDISHPFEAAGEITRPILWAGELYYGLYNWLIRLDPETGVIKERHHFPATITKVSVQTEHIEVQVEVIDELDPDSRIPVLFNFKPGQETSQEFWSFKGLLSISQDASRFLPGINQIREMPSAEARENEIAWLKKQAAIDRTNPFYHYYQGVLYLEADDQAQADGVFSQMLAKNHVHWTSWLLLASFLDRIGEFDWGDQAFEKVEDLLRTDELISLRRWNSILGMVLFLGWSRAEMDDAVQAHDYERIHRLNDRLYQVFPHIEQSHIHRLLFARWLEENGQTELARSWHEAANNPPQSALAKALGNHALRADLAFLIIISLFFGGTIAGLVMAIRRTSIPGRSLWLPKLSLLEWAALALIFLLSPLFLGIQKASVDRISAVNTMPIEIGLKGWSSPNTHKWISQLHPGDARDEFIRQIEDFSLATYRGELANFDRPTPDEDLLAQAVQDDTFARTLDFIVDAYRGDHNSFAMQQIVYFIYFLSTTLFILFIAFIGNFIGTRFPRVNQYARIIIPGAARSAGLLTPFICTAFILGLATTLLENPFRLHQLYVAPMAKYYGLSSIPFDSFYRYSSPYFFLLLGSTLLVHIATILLDIRQERRHENDI